MYNLCHLSNKINQLAWISLIITETLLNLIQLYGKTMNICPIKSCHVKTLENTHLYDFGGMAVESLWQFSFKVKREYFYKREEMRDKSPSDRQNILEERYPIYFNSPKQMHLRSIWNEIFFICL